MLEVGMGALKEAKCNLRDKEELIVSSNLNNKVKVIKQPKPHQATSHHNQTSAICHPNHQNYSTNHECNPKQTPINTP